MKKVFLLAALAIAALASCTKEVAVDEVIKVDVVPEGYVPITLNAQFDAATKASLSGNMVIWDVDEELAVFADGAGQPIKFTVTESFTLGSMAGVTIAGNVPATAKSFVAVYPWQEGLSCKDGVVSLSIPEEQVIPEGAVIDPKALPSVAYFADAESYGAFRNVMALVKFNVGQTEGVEEVKIALGGEGYTAGKVNVTYSTDDAVEPVIENACDAYSTVVAEGGFAPETDYWVAVGPVTATGLVAVARVGNRAYTRESKNEVVLERNKGIDLKDITLEASNLIVGISNAEELAAFLAEDGAATYPSYWEVKLLNDIDCSGVELPVAESYTGTFDGQGYKIMNWTTKTPLFATASGAVKNLTLDATCVLSLPESLPAGDYAFVVGNCTGLVENVINEASLTWSGEVTGAVNVGTVVGNASGGATISKCVNKGAVELNIASHAGVGTTTIGGVCARLDEKESSLIECVNDGNLTVNTEISASGANLYFGGITGCTNHNVLTKDCVNNGNITANLKQNKSVTALAGVNPYTSGDILNCINTGNIVVNCEDAIFATAIGGLAAYSSGKVEDSSNSGAIKLEALYQGGRNKLGQIDDSSNTTSNAAIGVGGLVGYTYNKFALTKSTNSGEVSVLLSDQSKFLKPSTLSRFEVGGLVGDGCGPISESSNSGNVSAEIKAAGDTYTATKAGHTTYVGGIVGADYISKNQSGLNITNCTNTGNVSLYSANTNTTNHTVGGIVGWPGKESECTSVTKGCINRGNLTVSGNITCRIGGIQGGSGAVEDCENYGEVYAKGGAPCVGGVAGFHGPYSFSGNKNYGDVKSDVACPKGIGGLIGNVSNAAAEATESEVNCNVVAEKEEANIGLILGMYNGAADKVITFGSEEKPFIVAGTVNGVTIDADNATSLIVGKTFNPATHKVYYSVGGEEFVHPIQLVRQWGWYSGDENWTKNVTAVSVTHPDGYGMARGLAMDDEYIYLPKSSGYAALGAVKITDSSSQVAAKVSGIAGGSAFVTSFARMIKNTDPEVNGGKDVLLLCNLSATSTDADQLRLYAYINGISEAPTQIAGFCYDAANDVNDWRRYGDRFFVTGTWQEGKVYFPSFNANKTVVLSIANGKRTAVTQIAAGAENSPEGVKDITLYPGSTDLFITNSAVANLVAPTGGKTNGWDEYTLKGSSPKAIGTFGYNFFEFNGKKYIAYGRVSEKKAWLEVIADKGDLLTSLEAQEGLMKAPIHSATDFDVEQDLKGMPNTADCCVRVIDGVPYIASMTIDGGLVVDKLVFKITK